MKQQAKIEATMLDKLKKDTEESGTEDVESNPKKTEEDDPDKNTEEEEEKEAENAVKFFNKYFRR